MNYDKIGSFIQQKRKDKGLTQKQLAEKLGVTDRAISKWERGQGCPDVSILEILSKELGCSILELLKGREIENIVTTHDSIYKVLAESGYKDKSTKEVVDYRSAIWREYEMIKEKGFISTNVLVELQGMIEHNKAGVRKNPGTKLVDSKTGKVIYTPPQEEKEIRDLLSNF